MMKLKQSTPRYLLFAAMVFGPLPVAADPLGIIRHASDEEMVRDIAANHPERLMKCQALDRQKMRFYGLTDRVSLTSYLWGYWEERPLQHEVYNYHTEVVEQAVNLGWGFARNFAADPSVTMGLKEEIGRVLAVVEDKDNIRWCRPSIRKQLFEFDRRMRAFYISLPD